VMGESEPALAHRPHQPALLVVAIDERLPGNRTVEERDDAVIAVDAALNHESGYQPSVRGAEVGDGCPYVLRPGLDQDLPTYGCHGRSLSGAGRSRLDDPCGPVSDRRGSRRRMLTAVTLARRPDFAISAVTCRDDRTG